MRQHLGKRLFITGIPTSGKSYLVEKLAKETGGIAVLLDDSREVMATSNNEYKKWAHFYLDKNEEEYLTKTSPEIKWADLVAQSEGLWPAFAPIIESYAEENVPVVFECVNLLPHIARANFNFPGIVLIGRSYEETLERNIKDPRWGKTPHLQELEARSFFYDERPFYKSEAEKYGYPVFETADDAFREALQFLK